MMSAAAEGGVPEIKTLISVQATYPVHITHGVLTCDDVIKVPLSYVSRRQAVINMSHITLFPSLK